MMKKYREIDREMAKAFAEWERKHSKGFSRWDQTMFGPKSEAVPESTDVRSSDADGDEYQYLPGKFSTMREQYLSEIEYRLDVANRNWLTLPAESEEITE